VRFIETVVAVVSAAHSPEKLRDRNLHSVKPLSLHENRNHQLSFSQLADLSVRRISVGSGVHPGKSIHEVDVAALKKNGGQSGSRAVSRDDFMHGAEEFEIPLLRQIFVVEFACGLEIERFRACSGSL